MNSKKVSSIKQQPSKKQNTVSNMLASETKKMEEKLELVKQMMELEKNKRSQIENSKSGATMWRGAAPRKSQQGLGSSKLSMNKRPPSGNVISAKNIKFSSKEEAKLNIINAQPQII